MFNFYNQFVKCDQIVAPSKAVKERTFSIVEQCNFVSNVVNSENIQNKLFFFRKMVFKPVSRLVISIFATIDPYEWEVQERSRHGNPLH